MRASSGARSAAGSTVRPRTTAATTALYSSSVTAAAHGHSDTPSCAGAQGAGSGVRGGAFVHRRSGIADWMASAMRCAVAAVETGPR